MYTEKELQWIQEFIDTRFDGLDASDEMISLMENSGLLKGTKAADVVSVKDKKSCLTKLVYSEGVLIQADNLIQ